MLNPVFHSRVHGSAIDQIHGTAEQVFQRVADANIVINRPNARLIQINQDVDVAVGLVVAPRDGPEKRSMKNAVNLQLSAVGAQFPQYRVTGHAQTSNMGDGLGEI